MPAKSRLEMVDARAAVIDRYTVDLRVLVDIQSAHDQQPAFGQPPA
jgi:hypothetical protein